MVVIDLPAGTEASTIRVSALAGLKLKLANGCAPNATAAPLTPPFLRHREAGRIR
jgi:hypothetical protein